MVGIARAWLARPLVQNAQTLLQKVHDRRLSVGRIRRRISAYLPRAPSGLSPILRHPFFDRGVRLVHVVGIVNLMVRS
jgi:hypothetical protein